MFTLILQLTTICNLKCKYCYQGEKENIHIREDIAKAALRVGVKSATKHNDRHLKVQFYGGEPLIQFNLMNNLIEYLNEVAANNSVKVSYFIVTNGTFLNNQIFNVLINNNFTVKISVDGTAENNDINRKFNEIDGTYNKILTSENVQLFKQHEVTTGKRIQAGMVISGNTFDKIFDNIKHLTEVGFRSIHIAFDYYYKWELEDFNEIKKQIYKIFEFYNKKIKEQDPFYLNFIQDIHDMKNKKEDFYTCKAGKHSLYVTAQGDFFPCLACTKKTVNIGNVFEGYYRDVVESIFSIRKEDFNSCYTCEIKEYCRIKDCLMLNMELNNSFSKPHNFWCSLEKLKFEILNKDEN